MDLTDELKVFSGETAPHTQGEHAARVYGAGGA